MKQLVKFYFSKILILLFSGGLTYGNNSLLPQPKEINYGKGFINISEIHITHGNEPSEEDRHIAKELSVLLSDISGTEIPVLDTPGMGYSLILERTGDVDALPGPGDKGGPDSREAYTISINSREARLTARSSAGLFYAVQTIRQLINGNGESAALPECRIHDWPEMPYRGFMMDMSHTQMPRIDEIKDQIDFLASFKANQYYFYSEASIELEGYPLLMANARYTREEVQEIIEYAKTRFVDVIPLMELYGHIHDLFRLEHYADLAVIPHGGEFKPYDPRVKPIVDDWITQMSELFPSPFFHIGFDETWLIRGEAEKLNMPPEKLYLDMLNQTTEIVERQGKIPMAFADMLQKYPSIIPDISKNLIAVPWHYFPRKPDEYDPLLSPFAEEGIPMVVQSALINWNWVYPSFEISFENTDLLLSAGRKYQAVGFINSGWTDDTQTIMRLSWPDLAYGSVASWQTDPMERDNFFTAYCQVLYPAEISKKLEEAHRCLYKGESLIRNALGPTDPAFFDNPFTDENLVKISENREGLRNGRLEAEKAQIHLLDVLKTGVDTTTVFAMLTGAKMLDYLALKYIYAGEISEFWNQLESSSNKDEMLHWLRMEVTFKYHTRTQDMMDAIMEMKELYRQAWLNEYRTFRLGVGLGKYDLEYQSWLKFQRRMDDVRRNYRADMILPSLESLFY